MEKGVDDLHVTGVHLTNTRDEGRGVEKGVDVDMIYMRQAFI